MKTDFSIESIPVPRGINNDDAAPSLRQIFTTTESNS